MRMSSGTWMSRRDDGSVLPIALVCVVVLAVMLSAVASLEHTSLRAQSVLEEKADVGYAADAALESAISGLATDPLAGIFEQAKFDSGASADSQPCVKYEKLEYPDQNLDTDGDGVANDEAFDVEVVCRADDDSGTPRGSAGFPPDFVVRTLGGVLGEGNDNLSGSPYPFCDDRHGPSACEAGLYVGANVAGDGGLLVTGNGNTERGASCDVAQPAGVPCALVQSNSSIVSKFSGANKSLNVVGSVNARRACQNLLLDYDVAAGTGRAPTATECLGAGDSVNGIPMLPDPDFRHELWDFVRPDVRRDEWGENPTRDGVVVPDYDPTTPEIYEEAPPYQAPTTWDVGTVDPDGPAGLDPVTGDGRCDDGFMFFRPGSYRDLEALNDLMTDCANTLYWFMPGVFYFDFVDVAGGEPYWRSPTSFSQIVGGTPYGWAPGTVSQPLKTMVPNAAAPTAWGYNRNADSGDKDYNDVVNGKDESGDPDYGRVIDGREALLNFLDKTGVLSADIGMSALRSPLPADAVVANASDSVVLRVKEWHTPNPATGAALYEAGWPRLVVKPANGKSCALPLKQDGLGEIVGDVETFDLTNGCPTSRGAVVTGSGAPFPSNAGGSTKRWDANVLNELTVTYEVTRAHKKRMPEAGLDGIDVQVQYTGRPTPSYPGGCDVGGAGVQFIFGNLSRVYMRGNDVHIELCGSEGTKDRHALTVYGLADDYPHLRTTDVLTGQDPVVPKVPPPRVTSTKRHTNVTVTANAHFEDTIATGDAVAAQGFEVIGDGAMAFTDTDWAADDARIEFTLPADFVPAGSVVERVEVRISCAVYGGRVYLNVAKGAETETSDRPTTLGAFPETIAGCARANNVAGVAATDFSAATGPLWVYGDNLGQAAGDRPAPPRTDFVPEYDLTNALRRPTALNGASFKLKVASSGTWTETRAAVDGIEVVAYYRPPGTLRPLRGCLTFRLSVPDGTDPALVTNQYAGIGPTQHGKPFVTATDAAYLDGNSPSSEGECALLNVESQSAREGAKLHIVGVVYAPTAPLQFAGKDNEASFVTDAVVARHITVMRWTKGPNVTGLGGGSVVERDPRKVHLEVWYPSATAPNKRLIARATVQFVDADRDGKDNDAEILSWEGRL